jgi:hypothetical protein
LCEVGDFYESLEVSAPACALCVWRMMEMGVADRKVGEKKGQKAENEEELDHRP